MTSFAAMTREYINRKKADVEEDAVHNAKKNLDALTAEIKNALAHKDEELMKEKAATLDKLLGLTRNDGKYQ